MPLVTTASEEGMDTSDNNKNGNKSNNNSSSNSNYSNDNNSHMKIYQALATKCYICINLFSSNSFTHLINIY